MVPDYFNGEGLSPDLLETLESEPEGIFGTVSKYASLGFQIVTAGIPFMYSHKDVAPKIAIIEAVIKELKANHGITKVRFVRPIFCECV